MKIYSEKSLYNFEFWSGAKDTAETLTYEELSQLESTLEELFPEGMGETELNDFFWFENDTIAEWLGFEDWEALERDHNGEEEEND